MNLWGQPLELNSGVGGSELPVDAFLLGVTLGLPGSDLLVEDSGISNHLAEALPRQHIQLDLGDVEPLGRAAVLHLLPLSHREVTRFPEHPKTLDEALLAGGYPRIFDQNLRPADWLSSYVATYLERDVRTITQVGDLVAFQRFVQLCAGRVGQLLNTSSLATDCRRGLGAEAWIEQAGGKKLTWFQRFEGCGSE